jgi:hypothetical protein
MMSIENYRNAKRPDLALLVTFIFLSSSVFIVDMIFFKFQLHRSLVKIDKGRIVLLYYGLAFISFWLVYFFANSILTKLFGTRVQSLRFLLQSTTCQWDNQSQRKQFNDKSHGELVKEYLEKAKVTITAQAIIIAVSTLLIVNIYNRRNAIITQSIQDKTPVDSWEMALLHLGFFIFFNCLYSTNICG